jgi:hypothetical protein
VTGAPVKPASVLRLLRPGTGSLSEVCIQISDIFERCANSLFGLSSAASMAVVVKADNKNRAFLRI